MQKLSVVIVCKNEAAIIARTLQSLEGLTDDIVVFDTGSLDQTIEVVKKYPARLFKGHWEGFGRTKNRANQLAKYEWVLSLDADEAIDEELKASLLRVDLSKGKLVYQLKFRNYFVSKWLRFGEWGRDKHIRLFNREQVQWNDAEVHESLVIPGDHKVITLEGFVLHMTVTDLQEYKKKLDDYAARAAEKYLSSGRKSFPMAAYFSSAFSFLKNYFFRLGFLDGKEGFRCASMTANYTFQKYKKLEEITRAGRLRQ